MLFIMLIVVAFIALVAWPAKEIYDAWGVPDDLD